jgi:radical SAM superfamily enzyme YgiQ (UPF0313 family)
MTFRILLISTYEMGRQPFGLASPAAWLGQAGFSVRCLDLAVSELNPQLIGKANLVAFHLPMHRATRLAGPVIERVRQINPAAHLCCFGLYAPVNAPYLTRLGVHTLLGGEFESELVAVARRLATVSPGQTPAGIRPAEPIISLDRQQFLRPDRHDLPPLDQYARLLTGSPTEAPQLVGYTEASRGCKHRCRHCPVVPVYNGRFRVVQPEVVLADIRQQVAAGAQHITFGDPDFFNGPGHALPLVTALHQEFPTLTYDVTIKVEHLRRYAAHLPSLKATGCRFITTAVESFDEETLAIFAKQHHPADFEAALTDCRALGLELIPTFVAFTPWTTLTGYRYFLSEIARLGLVEQVAPIQYSLRLLVPPGSHLLTVPEVAARLGPLDEANLSYRWQNPDPGLDQLQQDIERLVQTSLNGSTAPQKLFGQIWSRLQQDLADVSAAIPLANWPTRLTSSPRLTEPWYC